MDEMKESGEGVDQTGLLITLSLPSPARDFSLPRPHKYLHGYFGPAIKYTNESRLYPHPKALLNPYQPQDDERMPPHRIMSGVPYPPLGFHSDLRSQRDISENLFTVKTREGGHVPGLEGP